MINRIQKHQDQELHKRIVSFLQSRQRQTLNNLDVEVEEGIVTLRGTVRSYYEKSLGQQCCQRVAGVLSLIDEIDVDEVNSKDQAIHN